MVYRDDKTRRFQYERIRRYCQDHNFHAKEMEETRRRANIAIRGAIKYLHQSSCTDDEILKFLGKYAKKFNVSLTNAMIKYYRDIIIPEKTRDWEEVEINTEWDLEKKFLIDDVKALKIMGFTLNEIQKFFNLLLLNEYFSESEKNEIMSDSFIENL